MGPRTNVVAMQASTPGVLVRFQNMAKKNMPANGIIRYALHASADR